MFDFMTIKTRRLKSGMVEVYPTFILRKSSDLMVRAGDFYAVWVEERGLWSTDEYDFIQLVDNYLDQFVNENQEKLGEDYKVCYMWDSESGSIDAWHRYCQKQSRDSYHPLDETLIFSNTETTKTDYASKKLNYPLETGEPVAWNKLMTTLYSEAERHKIEWAIGSIVSGDSKKIQKFMVLYGGPGTGKSTVLNIIQQLFEGYYSVFDAKALGSSSNVFALEAFKTNPLVAIQHDGDLSRIEDNTRLNSLVSHEYMTINEKFKSTYTNQFKCFLFMGTNKPVKITDGKSGIIRRLIDVSPSGNKLSPKEYKTVTKQIGFELGAIANYCHEVYLEDPGYYDDYIPVTMLGASNDFYNYIIDSYSVFKKENGTTLKAAWEMYKVYCDEARVPYPLSQRNFKEELKNYFWDFTERFNMDDGSRVRSYYSGFRTDKFEESDEETVVETHKTNWLEFGEHESIFDKECADCPAQYANSEGTPLTAWDNVKTTLSSIDTSRLHYARVPEVHIVADFDIPDGSGNKCLAKNLEEASKWPPTYAELSKSGEGIHLHYIYAGDPTKLSRCYDDKIEIKVFSGKSSLRRKLTKCNNLPIATISSGLPLKGDDKLINWDGVKNEKMLRTMIKRNLNKEYHAATKPSVDYIYKLLEDAYASGIPYDVTDMTNAVIEFAANSSHQSAYCLKLVNKMQFKSAEPSSGVKNDDEKLIFYDVEVFPNLFLVNWKIEGEGKPVVRMINPSPKDIEELLKFRLVGFNCRRYDNHILYGRLLGYDNERLYDLSQRIISGDRNAFFGAAYNISYTDVYDFSSKKQSLKKFEIELGIHHQELGLPWDQPVPEELWTKVAEYCDNDVIATEAVFNARKADFIAREILADVAGMTVNDTTNSLTTRIIFGKNRNPQSQFNYRNMGDASAIDYEVTKKKIEAAKSWDMGVELDHDYTAFDQLGRPIFPGYKYEAGVSTYRDEVVGEGGYVHAMVGMFILLALLDVASMHPASIIAEQLFGPEFTKRFQEIRDARVAIKHKDFDAARKMLNGALAKYLEDESAASDLAQALKIAINSVYGLTSAKFDNPFRDIRNKDNIVAKRGALFMINLKHEVEKRGFSAAHIKTDSIKIPEATPEIIQFVMGYGQMYGYTFEHEETYDRMCLVNDAVYIAKYSKPHIDKKTGEEIWWTATGTQFQVPYVFKRLFSRKPIEFDDMCETKSVTSSLYLDMNEALPEDEHDYHFVGRVGRFCPVVPGSGGGELMREAKDREGNLTYAAATGTKGYRWLETEMVKELGKEGDIDRSYYDRLVNEAVENISQYGDFEWFVSDDSGEAPWANSDIPFTGPNDVPPWEDVGNLFDVR